MRRNPSALRSIILGVVAIAIAGVSVAGAWSPLRETSAYMMKGGDEDFSMFMAERLMNRLDMTDEQKAMCRAIIDEHKPIIDEHRKVLRENGFALMDVTPDDSDYDRIVAEMSDNAARLAPEIIAEASRMRAEIYRILTPKQKDKAAEIKADMSAFARQFTE